MPSYPMGGEEPPFFRFFWAFSPVEDLSAFMPLEMTFSNSFPVKSCNGKGLVFALVVEGFCPGSSW